MKNDSLARLPIRNCDQEILNIFPNRTFGEPCNPSFLPCLQILRSHHAAGKDVCKKSEIQTRNSRFHFHFGKKQKCCLWIKCIVDRQQSCNQRLYLQRITATVITWMNNWQIRTQWNCEDVGAALWNGIMAIQLLDERYHRLWLSSVSNEWCKPKGAGSAWAMCEWCVQPKSLEIKANSKHPPWGSNPRPQG